jgi:hypothetical protein
MLPVRKPLSLWTNYCHGCKFYSFKCLESNGNFHKSLISLFVAPTAVLMTTLYFMDMTAVCVDKSSGHGVTAHHRKISKHFHSLYFLSPSVTQSTTSAGQICIRFEVVRRTYARAKFDQKSSNSYDVPRCINRFSPPVRLPSELHCVSPLHRLLFRTLEKL